MVHTGSRGPARVPSWHFLLAKPRHPPWIDLVSVVEPHDDLIGVLSRLWRLLLILPIASEAVRFVGHFSHSALVRLVQALLPGVHDVGRVERALEQVHDLPRRAHLNRDQFHGPSPWRTVACGDRTT